MIISFLAGLISLLINRGPTPPKTWRLDDIASIYTIHGVGNYDRAATYYLYKETNGIREVARVDPTSPVDFTHVTDKPVKINGSFVIAPDGGVMVRITYVEILR